MGKLSDAEAWWLGSVGAVYLLWVVFWLVVAVFTIVMPFFVYGCLRNLRKIRLAQEETNKLLRQQIAAGRGVVTVQKPRG